MSRRIFVKKLVVVAALTLLIATLAACRTADEPTPVAPAAPAATPAPATPAPAAPGAPAADERHTDSPTPVKLTPWGIAYIDDFMSYEEIVERAMQEGQLLFYTVSSRGPDVAATFMARYPGIDVEVINISASELVERFYREFNAGIRNVDVVNVPDSDGAIWMEFVQGGMLHVYWPYDIMPYFDLRFAQTALPYFIEYITWFYNTEVFPDGQPINSWWDLLDPQWYGRLISRHPLEHMDTLAVWITMIQNADDMAADYERVFGRPIVLSPGIETAAHEFIKRFFAQDVIFLSSSGDISRTIGSVDEPMLGLSASTGFRRIEAGYTFNIITELSPSLGLPAISNIYIAEEANNPFAAKLFVRYVSDYHGEGFEPFNTQGGWSPRVDIEIHEVNAPIDTLNFWDVDLEDLYFSAPAVADFIRTVLP